MSVSIKYSPRLPHNLRKSWIYAGIILLLCIVSSESSARFDADSLWTIWTETQRSDTSRMEALQLYIQENRALSPDRSLSLADKGLKLAERANQPQYTALFLRVKGQAYAALDNEEAMKEAFERATQLFYELDQYAEVAGIYEKDLSAYYEQKGDREKVSAYLDLAVQTRLEQIDELKKAGEEYRAAEVQNLLSRLYFKTKDFAKSLEVREASQAYFEGIGDKEQIADGYSWLSWLAIHRGEIQESIRLDEKGLKIWRELNNTYQIKIHLNRLKDAYNRAGELFKALECMKEMLALAIVTNDKKGELDGLWSISLLYYENALYAKSLKSAEELEKAAMQYGDTNLWIRSQEVIGTIYVDHIKEYKKAIPHYTLATELSLLAGDSSDYAIALANEGTFYLSAGQYDKAERLMLQSLDIMKSIDETWNRYSTLIYLGKLYTSQGNYEKAITFYREGLDLEAKTGTWNIRSVSQIHTDLGNIYDLLNRHDLALKHCTKAWELAQAESYFEMEMASCECLYKVYHNLGNKAKAYDYLRQLTIYQDTVDARELKKKVLQYEFANRLRNDSLAQAEKEQRVTEAHQREMLKEEKNRNLAMGASFVLLLVAGGFYSRWRYIKKSRSRLQVEKDRSENLLLNILPEEIAEELKEKGHAEARDFEQVSILFTDFKGFTEASGKMNAQDLVSEINTCFKAFDKIIEKYGIEKIKTIGDAYMAAGGLPVPTADATRNTVLAALEMQEFIGQRKIEMDTIGQPAFEMRVGIHTGPVVAGIVGVKKFQYDIWGDTVNTASRMESSGEVGKVNISQSTYEIIKNEPDFEFESRGLVEAKGKGEMEMWFVFLGKSEKYTFS